MQHEERQPEDREGVLGAQLGVVDIHVQLLAEPGDGEGGQLAGFRIDVGQVVAGMSTAVTGQRQAAAVTRRGTSVAVKLP